MSAVEELLHSRAPVTLLTHADAAATEFLGAAQRGLDGRAVAPAPVQIQHEGGLFPAVLASLGDATAAITAGRELKPAAKGIARGVLRAVGGALPGLISAEVLAILKDRAGENVVAALEGSFDAARRELFPDRALQQEIAAVTPTLRSDVLLGFVTALSELVPGSELLIALRGGERLSEVDRLLLATLSERLADPPCRVWVDFALRDWNDRDAVRWLRRAGEIGEVLVASVEHTEVVLGTLDAEARMAAKRLAVLERPPAPQQAASLLGLALPEWFEVRERLLGAGLWVDEDAAGPWFEHHHRRAIVERLPSDEREAFAAAGVPRMPTGFIDPQPLLANLRLDRFVGREWLMRRVDEFIARAVSGYFVIEAGAGLGKTTFLARLARLRGYPCHFTSLAPRAEEALANLAAQLAAQWELGEAFAELPSAASPLRDVLAAAARRRDERAPGTTIVLVVDGLDEGETPRPEGNVLALPRELPLGVCFVVSQRPAGARLSVLGEKVVERLVADDPDNDRDAREYLDRVSSSGELGRRLAGAAARGRFAHSLAERSGGVWIYLHHAIAEIEAGRASEEVARLPRGLSPYYADFWRRWSEQRPREWSAVELPLLGALAAAREPLSLDRLCAIGGVEDPTERWLLEVRWRAFLTESPGPVGHPRRYALYHESLREFLSGHADAGGLDAAERALADELAAATRAAHARIADRHLRAWGWLRAGLPNLRDEEPADEDARYGLRHLPVHLAHAGRWDDLVDLLLAPRFLAARLAIGGTAVADLQRDCAMARTRLPADHPRRGLVGALGDTVTRQAGNLARQDLLPLEQLRLQAQLDGAPALAALFDAGAPGRLALAWTTQVTDPAYRRPWKLAAGWVYSLSMSADLGLAVGGDDDGNLVVIDLDAGTVIRRLGGHAGSVRDCLISADGRRAIAKGSDDPHVVVWDLASGRRVGAPALTELNSWEVAFSADGGHLLVVDQEKGAPLLSLWELDAGAPCCRLDEPGLARAECCALAADAPLALSAHRDGRLVLWDLDAGTLVDSVNPGGERWMGCSLAPDGSIALAGPHPWEEDVGVVVWEPTTGRTTRAPATPREHTEALALTAAGRRALSGTEDGLVIAWDVEAGSPERVLYGHARNAVWSLAVSHDGRRALSATKGGDAVEWDLERLSSPHAAGGHDDWIWRCAISGDGTRSATVSGERLMVWENATGALLHDQAVRGYAIQELALNENGTRARLTHYDRTLYWNIEDDRELAASDVLFPLARRDDDLPPATIDLPGEYVEHCVQIGDNELLVITDDGTVQIWELRPQQRRTSLCIGEITCASSTADGSFILLASGAGHVFALALPTARSLAS